MRKRKVARGISRSMAIAIFSASGAGMAFAADTFDNTGGDASWSNDANWVDDSAPTSADSVLLDNSALGTLPSPMTLDQSFEILNLTLDSADSVTIDTGVGTNTLTLDGTGVDTDLLTLTTTATGTLTLNVDVIAGASGNLNVANALGTVTFGGALNGNFDLTKIGGGTVNLTAASTRTGALLTNINAGVLSLQNNNALGANTLSGDVTVNNGGTLNVAGGITLENLYNIVLNDGGTLSNTGTNTINSKLNVSTAVGANTVTINTGALNDILTIGTATNDLTGGEGSDDTIVVTGAGTLQINGASNYIGNWRLDSGITSVGTTNSLGNNTSGTITLNGGTLNSRTGGTSNYYTAGQSDIIVTNDSALNADRNANGSGFAETWDTLTIGAFTLSSTSTDAVTSGTSTINFRDTTLTGNATFNVTDGTSAATIVVLSTAVTDGANSYSITKTGNGRLTLGNSSSTYDGGVKIQQGTVSVVSATTTTTLFGSAGTGTITIGDTVNAGSATLLGGASTSYAINNVIVVQGITTNYITSVATSNTMTLNGGVTLNAPLTVNTTGTSGGIAFSTNDFNIGSNQLTVSAGGAGAVTFNSLLTGNGTLVVNSTGTGSTTLAGINTGYTGEIHLDQGLITGTVDSAFGSGAISMADGTQINLSNNTGSSRAYNPGTLTIAPTGTGTINFTGSSGRLNRWADVNLGSGVSGATLAVTATGSAGQLLALAQTTLFGDSTIYVGQTPGGLTNISVDAQLGIADGGNGYSLTKTGAGDLILGASNTANAPVPAAAGAVSTYGGDTFISAGSIRLGQTDSLPTGTAVGIASGAVLDLSASGVTITTANYDQEIAGLNDLSGAGGTVYGTITVNNTGVSDRTLTLSGSSTYAFSGAILNRIATNTSVTRVLAVNKTGSGTQTFSGANAYGGGTTLADGVLEIGPDGAETIVNATPLGLNGTADPFARFAATVNVPGAETNGVTAGMLVSGGGIGGGTTVTSVSGDTVGLSVGTTSAQVAGSALSFGNLNQVSVASAAGLTVGQTVALTNFATNSAIIDISGNIVTFTTKTAGNDTSTSSATFDAWTSLPTAGVVTFTGGTLRNAAGNTQDYSNRFSNAAGQLYKVDTNSNDIVFNTALTSSGGSFTKLGAGTLTFNAANTYDGATIITQGAVKLGDNERIADTSDVDFNGGTLNTVGKSETVQGLSLSDDSSIDLGAGASILTFTQVGTIDTGKQLMILGWSGSVDGGGTDQLYVTNSASLSALELASFHFVDPTGFGSGVYDAAQLSSGEVVAVALVPEPASMSFLMLGGMALCRRRRRRQKAIA